MSTLIGGNSWIRVIGNGKHIQQPIIQPFVDNPKFIAACENVGIKPTRRQASKWLNKKGSAYKGK